MIDEAAVQALIDKQAITEAIYTYCRSVDRIDVPLGRSIWHDDAFADYGAGYYQGPGKDVIDLICKQHEGLLGHSHQITNILIDLDGNRAGSEAYATCTMRFTRDGREMHMNIRNRYVDNWERRAGRWGLVRREVVFDHDEIREVTTMGRPLNNTRDRADPSYAAIGRLSELA
jgi:hypothetical protein